MADEPDWPKLMSVLYEEDGWIRYPRTDSDGFDLDGFDYSDDHPFQQVDLNKYEIDDAVSYLRRVDLVVGDEKCVDLPEEHDADFRTVNGIALNERGFDVAHDREIAGRQDNLNAALVAFTLALVFVEIFGNMPWLFWQLAGYVVIMGFLFALVRWTDILDLPSL